MNEQQTFELIVPRRLIADSVMELQQANARILSEIDRQDHDHEERIRDLPDALPAEN